MIELVLGGNKSGKSDFGLELLRREPGPRALVATGKSRDLAFREQIREHRQGREAGIAVHETDTDLVVTLRALSPQGGGVLVDSLDFWMFAVMNQAGGRAAQERMREELLAELSAWRGGRLILVSTEMGLGPLAFDGSVRAFARDLGRLNREIARVSTSVYLVIAGLPQKLK